MIAAARSLYEARGHEQAEAWCGSAGDRGGDEGPIPAPNARRAPMRSASEPEDKSNAAEKQRVAVYHPLKPNDPATKASADGRQCHIDDDGIEGHDKEAEDGCRQCDGGARLVFPLGRDLLANRDGHVSLPRVLFTTG